MWNLFRSPSRSAAGAIMYVTMGTLMIIWAGLWYYYFLSSVDNPPVWQKFACVGTILSGLAIMIIGLLFGPIGRDAKQADNVVAAASPEAVVPVAPKVVQPVGITALPTASLGRSGTVERFSDGSVAIPR